MKKIIWFCLIILFLTSCNSIETKLSEEIDSSRILNMKIIKTWLELYYSDYAEYPLDINDSKFQPYIYGVKKDPKEWEEINWCVFWINYTVLDSEVWIKNYLFKLSTCLENKIDESNVFDLKSDNYNLSSKVINKSKEIVVENLNEEEIIFKKISKEDLNSVVNNTYIMWNKNSKITLIMYGDLECPFCSKLYNNWIFNDLLDKYSSDLNIIFNHYPTSYLRNSQMSAEILECLWGLKGSEAFYNLIDNAYKNNKSDKLYLINKSVSLWADQFNMETCYNIWDFRNKVKDSKELAFNIFGINSTPANVLINNETLEFYSTTWFRETSDFITVIDKLIK